jgi:hypothetical protein
MMKTWECYVVLHNTHYRASLSRSCGHSPGLQPPAGASPLAAKLLWIPEVVCSCRGGDGWTSFRGQSRRRLVPALLWMAAKTGGASTGRNRYEGPNYLGGGTHTEPMSLHLYRLRTQWNYWTILYFSVVYLRITIKIYRYLSVLILVRLFWYFSALFLNTSYFNAARSEPMDGPHFPNHHKTFILGSFRNSWGFPI